MPTCLKSVSRERNALSRPRSSSTKLPQLNPSASSIVTNNVENFPSKSGLNIHTPLSKSGLNLETPFTGSGTNLQNLPSRSGLNLQTPVSKSGLYLQNHVNNYGMYSVKPPLIKSKSKLPKLQTPDVKKLKGPTPLKLILLQRFLQPDPSESQPKKKYSHIKAKINTGLNRDKITNRLKPVEIIHTWGKCRICDVEIEKHFPKSRRYPINARPQTAQKKSGARS